MNLLHRIAPMNTQKHKSPMYARVDNARRAGSKETRRMITAHLCSLSPYQKSLSYLILSPTIPEVLFKLPRRFARRQRANGNWSFSRLNMKELTTRKRLSPITAHLHAHFPHLPISIEAFPPLRIAASVATEELQHRKKKTSLQRLLHNWPHGTTTARENHKLTPGIAVTDLHGTSARTPQLPTRSAWTSNFYPRSFSPTSPTRNENEEVADNIISYERGTDFRDDNRDDRNAAST